MARLAHLVSQTLAGEAPVSVERAPWRPGIPDDLVIALACGDACIVAPKVAEGHSQ